MRTLVLLALACLAELGFSQAAPFPLSAPVVGTASSMGLQASGRCYDVNGDGKDDIAGLMNQTALGFASVGMMCSVPGGGYGAPTLLATVPNPQNQYFGTCFLADATNDGIADVISTSYVPNPFGPFGLWATTSVRPGLGNCTFGPLLGVGDPNVSSYHQVFVNPNVPGLTGPGLPAAVILNTVPLAGTSTIYTMIYQPPLNSWISVASLQAPVPPQVTSLFATVRYDGQGDVNGDGLLDLVGVASGSVSFPNNILTTHVVWTLGAPAAPYFTIPAAVSSGLATLVNNLPVRVADVNNDGRDDVVGINVSGQIVVYLGSATPFATLVSSALGATPASFFVEDLDGDGAKDLIYSAGTSNYSVGFSRGNGLGGFAPPMVLPYAPSNSSNCLVAADANGDGLKDAVGCAANQSPTFALLNQTKIGPGANGNFGIIPHTTAGIANAGSPFYFVGVSGGAPSMPAVLGVSLAVLAAPDAFGNMLDPAFLVLPTASSIPFQTNVSGSATLAFGLPPLPALVGQTIYFEWAVVDAAAVNGFSLTPARKVVFW